MGFFWNTEAKEEKRGKELLDLLEKHPLVEKVVQEQRAEVHAKRASAAAAITDLEREREQIIPGMIQKKEAAGIALSRAKDELKAAEEKFNMASRNLLIERGRYDNEINAQRTILLDTFDERITEAQEYFQARMDWLRHPDRITERSMGAERNLITEEKKILKESNAPATMRAIEYCRDAMKALEVMKMQPEIDLDLIEALKAGIPSIDTFEQSTETKPLPGSKSINPLHFLKSDFELNSQRERVEEKFKKWRRGK